jgi:pimeloyl-ACP methyl ester carboxylesterase
LASPVQIAPPERRNRWLLPFGLGLLVAVVALSVALWPVVCAYTQSVALLMQWNGSHLPAVLKPIAGRKITIQDVTIPSPNGPIRARIYSPANVPNAPGLVFIHGLNHQGIDEAKMKRYARWKAASGIRVLTPDISDLRAYSIQARSIDTIGESARWFAQQTRRPVTLMGVSFAGGMALMAASRPAYASSVKMVLVVGGYDNLRRVAHFYATGTDQRPDGSTETIHPNPFGAQFLEYTDLALFVPPNDRAAVEPVLGAVLFDERSLVPEMESNLTPEQRKELESLLAASPDKAKLEEIADHDAPEMASVSPHGQLAGLSARVFILHGLDDDYIPSAEAQWTVRDLPPGKLGGLLITPVVSHIMLGGKSVVWMDKWHLIQFMAHEREAEMAQ